MYNELLQSPAFSNSEVPLTFPQFVALTQSITFPGNQVSKITDSITLWAQKPLAYDENNLQQNHEIILGKSSSNSNRGE